MRGRGNKEERLTIRTPEVGAAVHEVDAVEATSSLGHEDGALAVVLVRKEGVTVGGPAVNRTTGALAIMRSP